MTIVKLSTIKAIRETDGGGADEIYVLTVAINLAQSRRYRGFDQSLFEHEVLKIGPVDMDSGDLKVAGIDYPDEPLWGLAASRAGELDPDNTVMMAVVIENDSENPDHYRNRLEIAVRGILERYTTFRPLARAARQDLLTRLLGINLQLSESSSGIFSSRDDVVGRPQEIIVTAEDLAAIWLLEVYQRSLQYVGHGGIYRLTYSVEAGVFSSSNGARNGLRLRQRSGERRYATRSRFDRNQNVVTIPWQLTQELGSDHDYRWDYLKAGTCYAIRHFGSAQYLDAHEVESAQFVAVSRQRQADDTQKWIAISNPDGVHATLQQLSGRRYLSAGLPSVDQSVVTKPSDMATPDLWDFVPDTLAQPGVPLVRIRHKPTGKFLVGRIDGRHFRFVLTDEPDIWSLFYLEPSACVFRLLNTGTDVYMDVHKVEWEDHAVVCQTLQSDQTQMWLAERDGNTTAYNFRQLSSGQFLDAHEVDVTLGSQTAHFMVTRAKQDDETQLWTFW